MAHINIAADKQDFVKVKKVHYSWHQWYVPPVLMLVWESNAETINEIAFFNTSILIFAAFPKQIAAEIWIVLLE